MYDAIVIGSGQAGNPLCYGLADHGWKVALVEKAHLGGTCNNTGCTPTKTMVASAQVAHYARHAAKWGVQAGEVSLDLARVVALKEEVVQQFRAGRQRQVDQRENLHLYRGHARFLDARRIQVGADTLESERIFINTGTRPEIPRLEGLDEVGYLTNATLMEVTELPEHLLVLGGGTIGMEFGQMFRRFGSRVTVVHRSGQLLPREAGEPRFGREADSGGGRAPGDVVEELQRALEAEGIRFLLNTSTTRVERRAGQIVLSLEGTDAPASVSGTHLLVATGRRANTDDLGLDRAGVETDAHGFVRVNSRLETNVPGIWALGDVKGGPAFTHISYNDYQIVYANLVEGRDQTIDRRIVPYAVFTDPQLGGVGMTEKEARAAGHRIKVADTPTP